MIRIASLLTVVLCMATAWAADLPITNVVLYSSGVGFFERSGKVTGNETVQLTFKTEQINDLLKSLVLLDLDGGKAGVVTYGAKDPVSKTLQAFAVNINDNPTLGELLNRLRGVPVQVVATTTITGKILGVEKKRKVVGEEIIEYEVLNILTDDGIKSVRLEEITSLKILDERLNKELQEALSALATGLDNRRKPVMISFTGKGERRVAIGYISEAPVWKTSYRLVLGDAKKDEALLQGWAIVENTSDADWTNVKLSLVSGRPISYIMDLYTPLYVARPVVQPQVFGSIGPVEYDANLEGEESKDDRTAKEAMPSARAPMRPMAAPPAPGLNAGRNMADGLRGSVATAAQASDLGQVFEYKITEPVTLPRQQSAMLPIVNKPVSLWQVSIYNPDVQPKFPLYGFRLKNNTGLHLMGGPVTVYREDVYAGDAIFEDLQPGEQRLISYAMDLGMEGNRKDAPQIQEVVSLKLVNGTLTVTFKYRRTVEYLFKVKDGKERRLIVEHQFISGWDLVEPAKADEVTANLYRFNLPVTDKGAKLSVVEERTALQTMVVTDVDTRVLVGYLQTGKISPAMKEALQRVIDLRNQIAEVRRQRTQAEQEIRTISVEQDRLRQNMAQLDRASDLYKRYVTKLGEQETRIEALRAQIETLQKKENDLQKQLQAYVSELKLE
ncbi:MAG: hypothetical protein ACYC7E_18550 [Armatimonadota bacterium]